jgi:hypothetical protein
MFFLRKNDSLRKNTVNPMMNQKKQTDENDRELEVSMYDNHECEAVSDEVESFENGCKSGSSSEKMKLRIHKGKNNGRPPTVTVTASSKAVTKKQTKSSSASVDKLARTRSSNVCFETNSHIESIPNSENTVSEDFLFVS